MKLLLLFGSLQILKVSAESTKNDDASQCVSKIVKNFYFYGSKITFVNINFSQGDNIIKQLSILHHVSILTRNTDNLENSESDGLIVASRSFLELLYKFPHLEREPDWSPRRQFLIVVNDLAQRDLLPIFNALMKLCIYNAIVINNERNPILYTYNPFENYGCGKKFDRIIEIGACSGPLHDIFFDKYVTGLKNCTFRVSSAHWPPFSIDPAVKKSPVGVEEFIIRIIGEREQFGIVHYNYSNDAENFSRISKNLSAIGPLMVIQERKQDMMFGGMLLTNSRATAFDFIWMHLPYVDDIRILVKAATDVDPWRNYYSEFTLDVWLILLATFIAYYAVMLLLIKSTEKGVLLFKMGDYFFQHGSRLPTMPCRVKFVFILWIWFASLMSSIYQSSLVGLITNPSKNYQIATREDISRFNLKLCISPVMAEYFISVEKDVYTNERVNLSQCDSLLRSIRTVSKSDNLYTYTLFVVYLYYKYSFYDEFGRSEIYAFRNPTNKVISAIYLYKGFPMLTRLQILCLRLWENGMTTYYFGKLLEEQKKNFDFKKPVKKENVVVPWYILIVGTTISSVVFIIELNTKPNTSRM